MDLWINYTSNDPTVSIKEGTDVFAYDRSNYIGTPNIGWKRGTFAKNGEMDIPITNHIVAWYVIPYFFTGQETLKYRTPAGQEEWLSFIDERGTHVFENRSSDFQYMFSSDQNGIWRFSLDMRNKIPIKDLKYYELGTPNVILYVVDLPDVSWP